MAELARFWPLPNLAPDFPPLQRDARHGFSGPSRALSPPCATIFLQCGEGRRGGDRGAQQRGPADVRAGSRGGSRPGTPGGLLPPVAAVTPPNARHVAGPTAAHSRGRGGGGRSGGRAGGRPAGHGCTSGGQLWGSALEGRGGGPEKRPEVPMGGRSQGLAFTSVLPAPLIDQIRLRGVNCRRVGPPPPRAGPPRVAPSPLEVWRSIELAGSRAGGRSIGRVVRRAVRQSVGPSFGQAAGRAGGWSVCSRRAATSAPTNLCRVRAELGPTCPNFGRIADPRLEGRSPAMSSRTRAKFGRPNFGRLPEAQAWPKPGAKLGRTRPILGRPLPALVAVGICLISAKFRGAVLQTSCPRLATMSPRSTNFGPTSAKCGSSSTNLGATRQIRPRMGQSARRCAGLRPW